MPQIELTVRNVFWQGRACDLLVSGGRVLELTEPGRETAPGAAMVDGGGLKIGRAHV